MALTKRQKEILSVVEQFIAVNDYSPSFEEIGKLTGLSSLATIHKHLKNLEWKGYIKRDYNRSRSIEILQRKKKFANSLTCPHCNGVILPPSVRPA